MLLSQPLILESSDLCFPTCLSLFQVAVYLQYFPEQRFLSDYYLPTPAICPTEQSVTKLTTLHDEFKSQKNA